MSQSPSLAYCKAAIWHSRSNPDSQMNPPHSCSGAAECPADPAPWGTEPWPPAALRLHQPCRGCSPPSRPGHLPGTSQPCTLHTWEINPSRDPGSAAQRGCQRQAMPLGHWDPGALCPQPHPAADQAAQQSHAWAGLAAAAQPQLGQTGLC